MSPEVHLEPIPRPPGHMLDGNLLDLDTAHPIEERENKQLHDECLQTAIEYKAAWEKELARPEMLGITGPEPLPHPKDVILDMRTGQVIVRGPMTAEEKARWEQLRERKAECDRSIAEDEQLLR